MSKKINLQETGNLLMAAQTLVLCCHVSPDGDTLGSALGLSHYLEQQGKKVTVLVDDDISHYLQFIPGIETCRRPVAEEQLEADLLVVIDASSADRIGICQQVTKAKAVLNIDHHISNTEFADYLYLNAGAAAVGEIMCDLAAANSWKLDLVSATCFYIAMVTDSGSFMYSCTTPNTMCRAAEMLALGVKSAEINDCLKIIERSSLELLAKVLPSLTFEMGGRLAHMAITNEQYDHDINTENYVNYPRYVEGVDVAVLFKAVEPQVTRVSMRSVATDVAAVAAGFGGGGHIRAAGCTVYAPLEEAKAQVIAALAKVM